MVKIVVKYLRVFSHVDKRRITLSSGVLLLFFFVFNVIPLIFWKTPPTFIGWEDSDFTHVSQENQIIILHWTSIYRERDKGEILNGETCEALSRRYFNPTENLSQMKCKVTYDRRYLPQSSALLFHSFDLIYDDLPNERNKDQPWVWVQPESPIYTRVNLQMYQDVFNWTMTYRRDSDVYSPDSIIVSRKIPLNNSVQVAREMLPQKTRLLAWIVSSCHSYSKREHLVEALQKHFPVDVYGWCGIKCPKHGQKTCYTHVENSHKFYLSFENSLCTDYITEKLFYAMSSSMVPIVYGGGGESDYSAIAPPHSYIDVDRFKSLEELASYLVYLDKNDTAYLEYFKWKDKYEVVTVSGWCDICQKVYSLRDTNTGHKWYRDIWRWWNYRNYQTLEEMQRTERIDYSYANQTLGPKICTLPSSFVENITANGRFSPDFEPSLFNGRLVAKYWEWMKDAE